MRDETRKRLEVLPKPAPLSDAARRQMFVHSSAPPPMKKKRQTKQAGKTQG